MASISLLPDEILLYISDYLTIQDRIAFAYAWSRFKKICHGNPSLMRKVDLSRHVVRKERGAVNRFFQDKQMVQHIKELNLNNKRVRNWQIDDNMEQFIIGICPHLEALHVLNCGISLESLHRILQRAPKLTELSFSIMDLTPNDIQLVSDNDICLENIRKLRIEIPPFPEHMRILQYLVLSRCEWLEELEIFIWVLQELEIRRITTDFAFLGLSSEELTGSLDHLYSLTVKVESSYYHASWSSIELKLYSFVRLISRKKSRQTNWKRFWISTPFDTQYQMHLCAVNELSSVEAFATNGADNVNEMKRLLGDINESAVRKLRLQSVRFLDEYLESIASIGGNALQSLSLYAIGECSSTNMDTKLVFNKLFSACANITELYILECYIGKNICESLSKLKHLIRIQITACGLAPDRSAENEVNAKLLTLVESCPNVKEFCIAGCGHHICQISRFLVEGDLLPIAKWTKLESLTCRNLSLGTEQDEQIPTTDVRSTFLENVVEVCHYLTTLKISIEEYDETSHFTFLKSAKFLKHLVINIFYVDLGLEDLWQLISCATDLERLCISSSYKGSVNIPAVVKMLKSLPGLYVLHLHYSSIRNLGTFRKYITDALKEEKSARSSCFEFLTEKKRWNTGAFWSYQKVLPLNVSELCYWMSGTALDV